MNELQNQILEVIKKIYDDYPDGVNISFVASAVSKDLYDSSFQTALDELVGNGLIRVEAGKAHII